MPLRNGSRSPMMKRIPPRIPDRLLGATTDPNMQHWKPDTLRSQRWAQYRFQNASRALPTRIRRRKFKVTKWMHTATRLKELQREFSLFFSLTPKADLASRPPVEDPDGNNMILCIVSVHFRGEILLGCHQVSFTQILGKLWELLGTEVQSGDEIWGTFLQDLATGGLLGRWRSVPAD